MALAVAGLGDWANRHAHPAMPWGVGGITGWLVGRSLAAATLGQPAVHQGLRVVGSVAVLGGLVGAVVFYVLAEQARQRDVFLAGLGEMVMAMLCVAGAVVGACFWFAGRSGRAFLREDRAG